MKEKHTKKGSGLNLLLLVIDLALLVWIVSAWAGQRKEPSQATLALPVQPPVGQSEPTQTEALPPAPEQVLPPENAAPMIVLDTELAAPAEPTAPTEPAPVQSVSYDTTQRPVDGDFLDWYANNAMLYGMPQGAEQIYDLSQLTGDWKGLIYYDPWNTIDSRASELLNFRLEGDASGVTLTAHWYTITFLPEGTCYSEEDRADSVFAGQWDLGSLWATGPGTIRLAAFYTLNGKQYAIGTMDAPDGTPTYVAMVRP